MQSFSVIRFLAAIVVAMGLAVAAGSPSAARDDVDQGRTAAQEVRQLVLKQRERVLAYVAAIMAGDEEESESAEIDIDEASEGEDEDAEEEGEDDGEDEDEGEDGEDEGEDEGVGGEAEDCEPQGGEDVGGGAEGEAAAENEAEGDVAAGDEVDADEAENAQPAGSEADTPGDQEICTLPSTGTGSNSDMHSLLSAFAALAAVTAAGFGLRQRFI